jgi:hypothetical protein
MERRVGANSAHSEAGAISTALCVDLSHIYMMHDAIFAAYAARAANASPAIYVCACANCELRIARWLGVRTLVSAVYNMYVMASQ